ncbi:MAG: hypothetical protein ACI4WH_02120 [Oscillospiraceae bacterium]
MKNLKRTLAMIMALGMISTSGIIANADTTDDGKQLYICGDTNLDGKLNTIDILLSKRVILHLAEPKYMYADGDTIKIYEDTQGEEVVIRATKYTVDVENSTIHITQQDFEEVLLDITVKVTDKTTFTGNFSNLEELAEELEANPSTFIAITYDSVTKEVSEINQIEYEPVELSTIFTGNGIIENYVYINVEEKTVHHEFGVELTETDLNITDDTEITSNGESITLDELSNIANADDYEYAVLIKYNPSTNDIAELSLLQMMLIPTDEGYARAITLKDGQYEMNINSQDGLITIPELTYLELQVTEDTIFEGITSLADVNETTHLDITYNPDTQSITKVSAFEDQTIWTSPYSNTNIVSATDNTITIDSYGKELILTVNENTTYSNTSIVKSFEDIKEYMGCAEFEISYNPVTKVVTNITADEYLMEDKPVIYLYPTEKTQVDVSLDLNGELTCTYPKYENGWSVIAEPDGTLYDMDGNEYYCLYWEGKQSINYDFSKGFVVKGEDTADFLREKLLYMGLTPKEANEFIIYWLPRMENNEYNLITFQDDIYTENAKLNITPQPDTLLRIFMAYKPLDDYIEVEPQELTTINRTGFTAVEWGGTEIK